MSTILLGDLSVRDIESRLEITLTDEEREKLESMRQQVASNIAREKWHCFDIPFTMVCGSMETATAVYQVLLPYGSRMKGRLDISIEGGRGQ